MTPAPGFTLLAAVRLLHGAGGALSDQAVLHARLASIEWREERARLLKMLLILLLGLCCLLGGLLFAAALAMAASWETAYRVPVASGLLFASGFGVVAAWQRFNRLSARADLAFSASREELLADAAALRTAHDRQQ